MRDLGLREAKDPEIFAAARLAEAIVLTKDADFVELVERLGPPPRLLWITSQPRLFNNETKPPGQPAVETAPAGPRAFGNFAPPSDLNPSPDRLN